MLFLLLNYVCYLIDRATKLRLRQLIRIILYIYVKGKFIVASNYFCILIVVYSVNLPDWKVL